MYYNCEYDENFKYLNWNGYLSHLEKIYSSKMLNTLYKKLNSQFEEFIVFHIYQCCCCCLCSFKDRVRNLSKLNMYF